MERVVQIKGIRVSGQQSARSLPLRQLAAAARELPAELMENLSRNQLDYIGCCLDSSSHNLLLLFLSTRYTTGCFQIACSYEIVYVTCLYKEIQFVLGFK
jgi:hypothetical protein